MDKSTTASSFHTCGSTSTAHSSSSQMHFSDQTNHTERTIITFAKMTCRSYRTERLRCPSIFTSVERNDCEVPATPCDQA